MAEWYQLWKPPFKDMSCVNLCCKWRSAAGLLSRARQSQHCEHPWVGAPAAESCSVSAGGSGKCYVERTQKLTTVSGSSYVPSTAVTTLGSILLPVPSSASHTIFMPLQSQTCSALILLLHPPWSPRLWPLPSQAAAWRPHVLGALLAATGCSVCSLLDESSRSTPGHRGAPAHPSPVPSSSTQAHVKSGRKREVPPTAAGLLPFGIPLTAVLASLSQADSLCMRLVQKLAGSEEILL